VLACQRSAGFGLVVILGCLLRPIRGDGSPCRQLSYDSQMKPKVGPSPTTCWVAIDPASKAASLVPLHPMLVQHLGDLAEADSGSVGNLLSWHPRQVQLTHDLKAVR
jgi:hypothetical protein